MAFSEWADWCGELDEGIDSNRTSTRPPAASPSEDSGILIKPLAPNMEVSTPEPCAPVGCARYRPLLIVTDARTYSSRPGWWETASVSSACTRGRQRSVCPANLHRVGRTNSS